MNNIIIKDLIIKKFYPVINDIFRHKYTHYWLKGGRGSTKSTFTAISLVLLLISNSEINAIVLRKVSATIKDSVFNQIITAIDLLGLSMFFKTTVNPLEITYKPTNQVIFFRGADDPLKIKSIKPRRGYIGLTWFEELDQFGGEEEIRNILQSTNRGGSKYWNFYTYNPPKSRDSWVNIEVNEKRKDKTVIHTTFLDVPVNWLGEQFVFDANYLKETKPDKYEHEYMGVPIGIGGAVFDNIENRCITDDEIKTLDKFFFGVDFGFAVDPFTWIKMSYISNTRTLIILDEIYKVRLRDDEAIKRIKDKNNNEKNIIVADSSSPKTIDYFNTNGLNLIPSKKGKDSVNRGIKWLQDLNKIVIDNERTPNTFREFYSYEYEMDKNGNYISNYPDKDNHSIDAVRYALENIINNSLVRWA